MLALYSQKIFAVRGMFGMRTRPSFYDWLRIALETTIVYDETGTMIREYIYLGNLSVAMLTHERLDEVLQISSQ